MPKWILPFKGRNPCGAFGQNFLWQHDNIYLMDNHRAAFWCWLQQQNVHQPHSVVHIDAHYDTVEVREEAIVAIPVDIGKASFENYLEIQDPDRGQPLFRWDNYLSIYSKLFGNQVTQFLFATHNIGTEPDFDYLHIEQGDLIQALEAVNTDIPHIINLDLDYFRNPREDYLNKSDRTEIMSQLHSIYELGICSAITICLSPECCGDWERAEELLAEVCSVFDIQFELPDKQGPKQN